MADLPRSVLTAVDFGDASGRAVTLSGLIVETCRVPVFRLLHAEALEAPPYFTADQIDTLRHQRQAMRTQAEQFLVKFGRTHTRAAFSTVIDDRPPLDAILHEAETADLLVMGTHGRHGPSRWWLGSVAERVLQKTTTPLLIARANGVAHEDAPFARLLVHASATLTGKGALDYARALATCFGGQVFDERAGTIESAVRAHYPTLVVVAAPLPRSRKWLVDYGEPLVRFCTLPILFVPEFQEGALS